MSENHGFEASPEFPEVVLENDQEKPPAIIENQKVYTFDEAITLARVGRFHYFVQIVCGMCLMTAVVEIMGISIVMPFINRDIPSTVAEKGFLASAGYLGMVLSSHAVGFLSDTWGRARMLRTTLSLSFITSIMSAFSVNIWMLIVLRFLTGFIMSACQGSVFNFVGEFHSKKRRAKYVTMLSMFTQLGMIFMPAVAIGILPLKIDTTILGLHFASWRLLMVIFSLMRIFALIGLFILPETPKFVLVQGDHEKTLKTLRMIYSKNTKKPEYEYPVHQIADELRGDNLKNVHGVGDAIALICKQTAPLFYKNRMLQSLNICTMMFLVCMISHGAYMWFPTILKQLIPNSGNGLTTCEIMQQSANVSVNVSEVEEIVTEIVIDTTMFKVLIIIGTFFSVTYFIFSLIINKVGKSRMLFTLILVSGCSCLVLQYMTTAPSSVVVLTVLISLSNCAGIIGTIAFEFFPTNVSGMGMSLIMMISRLGSMAGSNVMGQMIYANCDILFYFYFALCMLMLVLSMLLPKSEQKPQAKTEDN